MQTERAFNSLGEEKELLEEGAEEEDEYSGRIVRRHRPYLNFGPKTILAILFALTISLLLNFYIGFRNNSRTCTVDNQEKPGFVTRPSYSGLKYNKSVTFHAKTDWQSKNETLADELWDSISIDSVGVAISKDWATEHGLPPSDPFYWDLDKDLYWIKGIHDMHCLKYMRYYITRSNREGAPLTQYVVDHMGHCLDSLRQDIMCMADDTPMPSIVQGDLGDGQVMQCRDWDALQRWSMEPERYSCFHQASDYKHTEHDLERHANCSPDSPYYEVSRKYFDIHGHKNLFAEEEDSTAD